MIDACPRCGYLLSGLRERHRCPECGLDYDRNSLVFKQARWTLVAGVIAAGFSLLFCLVLIVGSGGAWRPHGLLLGAPVVVLVWTIWQLCTIPKRMIIVSDSQVRIFRSPENEEVVPTSQIVAVERSSVTGNIVIFGQGQAKLATIPSEFLLTARRARRATEAIQRCVEKRAG